MKTFRNQTFTFHVFRKLLEFNFQEIYIYVNKATSLTFHWNKWVKVFKNGPSKICGRQPLKI